MRRVLENRTVFIGALSAYGRFMASPSMPLAPANQWALAATAILTVTTRRVPRYDCLGGAPPGPEEEKIAKTILANSWGIESRQKLESMIEWLSSAGHSVDYHKAAAAYSQSPAPQPAGDPKLAFVGQYGRELGPRGLLAWDLGRLLAVAGWGFLAGYCNEFEAWGVMLPAAERIRNAYASWDEYGHHYRLGALFAMPLAAGQIEQVLSQLRAAPDSPWRLIPWKLDTPGAGGPQYGVTPPVAPYGAAGVPGIGSPGIGSPGVGSAGIGSPGVAYGGGVPGNAPYGAPGVGPYGGAPMAPMGGAYGGAPMAAMRGGSNKGKIVLLIGGLALAGFLVLGIAVGVLLHFTGEHEHEHSHEHGEPGKKKH
jgi:hypothetical protein